MAGHAGGKENLCVAWWRGHARRRKERLLSGGEVGEMMVLVSPGVLLPLTMHGLS
jgi:hypothetical protein